MHHQDFLKDMGQLMQKHGIVTLSGGTIQYDPKTNRIIARDVRIQKGKSKCISPEFENIIRKLEQENIDRLLEQALKNNDKVLFDKVIGFKNSFD